MFQRSLVAIAAIAVIGASAVLAGDKSDKAEKKLQEEKKLIDKKEAEAHAAIAKALVDLSSTCVMKNAIDDARSVLDLGLEIAPESKTLKDAKEKLKETKKPVPKDWDFAKARHPVYEKVAKILADFMVYAGSKGDWSHFEERIELLAGKLGSDAAVQATHAVYFEPYRRWFNPVEGKRLQDGGDLLDGKWLEAKEVAKLDEQHSKWSDPWVISDEVHEVRTTMPLRQANQILLHVGAYRDFFLKYVSDGWDLRKPDAKLPIVVTKTHQDYVDQMKAGGHLKDGDRITMAAVYMHSPSGIGPVYATFEPADQSGAVHEVNLDYVLNVLQHECTHQIAHEYSKWNEGSKPEDSQYWCVEGLATFMQSFRRGKTGWKLTHQNPKNAVRGGPDDFAFSFAKDNIHLPQDLRGFFELTHDHFVRADHYNIAAAASYFLLEGEGKKYRKGALKLFETVHQDRSTKKLLDECFPDADWKRMHDEYKRFVNAIQLDPVEKTN